MSVRLTCAICGRELHRIGVTNQVVCPLHGSRWQGVNTTSAANTGSVSPPSKPVLRDPDYDFGTSRAE